MLTYNEIVARVLSNVQDPNNDIFSSSVVDQYVNSAKDEVLTLVQVYTDLYPQSSQSVAFAAGESEKDLPADFLEPLAITSAITGSESPRRHSLVDFRKKNQIKVNDDLYLRREADGQWVIGRVFTTEALTVTVLYVADVDDQTTDGAGFTFGPKPADELMIAIATHRMLESRKRLSGPGATGSLQYWVNQEAKLTQRLNDVLDQLYKTDAEYVNAPDDVGDYW